MKLNLLLALGLLVSVGVAVVRDQQKETEFEERARAAEVVEARAEVAFQNRLAINASTNEMGSGDIGQASK